MDSIHIMRRYALGIKNISINKEYQETENHLLHRSLATLISEIISSNPYYITVIIINTDKTIVTAIIVYKAMERLSKYSQADY